MENPVNDFARNTTQVICDAEHSRGKKKKGTPKEGNWFKIGSGGREGGQIKTHKPFGIFPHKMSFLTD